jgi:hypothetical protein
MAVDAVLSELLSTINSLYQGKIQGILSILVWFSTEGMAQSLCIQDIYCTLVVNSLCKKQGIKSGYQGIGFPDTD